MNCAERCREKIRRYGIRKREPHRRAFSLPQQDGMSDVEVYSG